MSEAGSSPSIINFLRGFRFNNNQSTSTTTKENGKSEPPKTPPKETSQVVICETPEAKANHVSENPVSSQSSEVESPVRASIKKRPAKCLSSSSSEDESNKNLQIKRETKSYSKDFDESLYNNKELALKKMLREFDKLDLMEAQDVLVSCDWDVDAAIRKMRETKSKLSNFKKRKVIVISDDSNSVNEDSEPTEKKPVKQKKKKKREDDSDGETAYANDDVYHSEDSDDDEGGSNHVGAQLSRDRQVVLKFMQEALREELLCVPGCSGKKAASIIECRPFNDWQHLVKKLEGHRHLSPDMLNNVKELTRSQAIVTSLMEKCESISEKLEKKVDELVNSKSSDGLHKQPEILNKRMTMSPYQIIGLNWLVLMHESSLNGILADEMGLGKTVQSIGFLAFLKTCGIPGSHLIVVPSSTLDNWKRELQVWCPSLTVLSYHGSMEFRRELRYQILNDEVEDFDIIITTYNMVTGGAEDRSLFKKLDFLYVIFDEAHMLKNMATQRYHYLMRIKAERRLLLTGTPLQNNLVELLSLLVFVMPSMFNNKAEQITRIFKYVNKSTDAAYTKARIEHAKSIMKPFVLRRLKKEVLQQLPQKTEEIMHCPLLEKQREIYDDIISSVKKDFNDRKADSSNSKPSNGAGLLMQLRKISNHPLLIRNNFTDEILRKMSKLMLKEPTHSTANPDFVFEDMQVYSDFELHQLCKKFSSISSFALDDDKILASGKFTVLDRLLPEFKEKNARILLFSQFVMVLDIIEEYLRIRNHKFLRIDGSTAVPERQSLIDQFNEDDSIFIFLLSTKAGGLGINLTAANYVLIHDIDFNPYNDKQAEDRCHRVGQTKPVTVIRMLSENTIEMNMYSMAKEKLKLEQDLTQCNEEDQTTVNGILQAALMES